MSRVRLKEDHELPSKVQALVQDLDGKGVDTSNLRGFAHCQEMFDSYFQFYGPARKGRAVEEELIELVRLKIARHNDCFTWLNARLLPGAEHDLSEGKISQLDEKTNTFTERERSALEYADKLALDHHNIDDAFFDQLHKHFSDEQIIELGMMIGQFIGFGRLLAVLDLEPKFCSVDGDESENL
jgi:alkylhydroperoxidase family enzyme